MGSGQEQKKKFSWETLAMILVRADGDLSGEKVEEQRSGP